MQGIDLGLFWWLLLAFFLVLFITPVLQRRVLVARRAGLIHEIERKRAIRVITIIHRREVMSLLGITISRYIDVEDSVEVLRAIRLTDPKKPHRPGGAHPRRNGVRLPADCHDAQSPPGEGHRGRAPLRHVRGHAACAGRGRSAHGPERRARPSGPADPGGPGDRLPRDLHSRGTAAEEPEPRRPHAHPGDIARKATTQVENAAFDLLAERKDGARARRTAKMLVEGEWTHDRSITPDQAREMGLPVSTELPDEFHRLLELYPQPGRRMATLEYFPGPYPERERPPRGGRSRGKQLRQA